MSSTSARRYGKVFDEVAADYDRNRPTYPDELVDRACRVAGIGSGDPVLEVGCGSGQLTRGLVARGLHVTALEPGRNLLSLAEQNLEGPGQVGFVQARFEDAQLPHSHFRAVFSASAWQWIDPEVSWQKAARALVPGGTLALIQYCGLQEERSAGDQEALLSALARVAPEIAAGWPRYWILPPSPPEWSSAARTSPRCGPGSEATTWRAATPAVCSARCGSPACRRSSSKPLTNSMRCLARRRSTSGSQRTSGKPLRAKASRSLSDSDDRSARAPSPSSSRHDAAPRPEPGKGSSSDRSCTSPPLYCPGGPDQSHPPRRALRATLAAARPRPRWAPSWAPSTVPSSRWRCPRWAAAFI